MKKPGIIGGIGPASTLDYYSGIIESYRARTGKKDYPEIAIDSIDMTKMLDYLTDMDYDSLEKQLFMSIENLRKAGADFVAIASNTPHIIFDRLRAKSLIPLLSIVDAACSRAKSINCQNTLILGTKFTMTNGLYTNKFSEYRLRAFVPDEAGIETVHQIIFPKLEDGIVDPEDKKRLLGLCMELIESKRADSVLLGCTELPLMIREEDLPIKVLNTTQIHIEAIVDYMLQDQ